MPHPSENKINVRVQTTGKTLRNLQLYSVHHYCVSISLVYTEVFNTFGFVFHIGGPAIDNLKKGLKDLNDLCEHTLDTFKV